MKQPTNQPTIDMADVLTQRVSDSQPLYVAGKLDEAAAKVHVATVNAILESTGKPVTVVYMPAQMPRTRSEGVHLINAFQTEADFNAKGDSGR